jgi:N,N'-diacetyllegionaminate synthase
MSIFIIAEIGINHNGDINIAKKLIDVAKDAGADAVKFQTFKATTLMSKHAIKSDYQQKTTNQNESAFEMIRKLELDIQTHQVLIEYAREHNIMFLSTPFDIESVKLLNNLGLPIMKIPSGEITNLPYLRAIGSSGCRVILSTGMATLGEIESALHILISAGTPKEEITILHANTEYPTPMCDVNLKAMQTIATAFNVNVGYSDHTLGIEVDIAAVAMGACIIEKHFTLDQTMEGPDHKASLEPDALASMVKAIRNIELALGNGIKVPSPSESKNILHARKSIVAVHPIKAGEILDETNLTVKRPGGGISPMEWDRLIGQPSRYDYESDDRIRRQ